MKLLVQDEAVALGAYGWQPSAGDEAKGAEELPGRHHDMHDGYLDRRSEAVEPVHVEPESEKLAMVLGHGDARGEHLEHDIVPSPDLPSLWSEGPPYAVHSGVALSRGHVAVTGDGSAHETARARGFGCGSFKSSQPLGDRVGTPLRFATAFTIPQAIAGPALIPPTAREAGR